MKTGLIILYVIGMIISPSSMFSQDDLINNQFGTLFLLSGDTVSFLIKEDNEWLVNGVKKKKNGKEQIKNYPIEDVFSFKAVNKDLKYFYEHKPSKGTFLSVKEMEQYVLGQKEAIYNYKSHKYLYGSIFFGMFVSLVDTYSFGIKDSTVGFFKGKAGWPTLATPFFSGFLVKKNNIRLIDRNSWEEEDVLKESYRQGYNSIRNTKDSKSVFLGSTIGVVIILVVREFVNKN